MGLSPTITDSHHSLLSLTHVLDSLQWLNSGLSVRLPAVVAVGAAEAAAAAAQADGDPGSAHAAWQQQQRWRRCRQRSGGPPPPVPHAVLARLHLSHPAREAAEPGHTGQQQQTALHHR